MSASRLGLVEGPEPEPEGGTNMHPSEVVENSETTCPGTALSQAGTPQTGARK